MPDSRVVYRNAETGENVGIGYWEGNQVQRPAPAVSVKHVSETQKAQRSTTSKEPAALQASARQLTGFRHTLAANEQSDENVGSSLPLHCNPRHSSMEYGPTAMTMNLATIASEEPWDEERSRAGVADNARTSQTRSTDGEQPACSSQG